MVETDSHRFINDLNKTKPSLLRLDCKLRTSSNDERTEGDLPNIMDWRVYVLRRNHGFLLQH